MGSITYNCPSCGNENVLRAPLRLDTTAGTLANNHHQSEDGDLTNCPQCNSVIKNDHGKWRIITDEEWLELSVEDRAFIKRIQKVHNKLHDTSPRSFKEKLGDALELMPAAIPAMPWMIASRLIRTTDDDKARDIMRRGITTACEAICKRPDSKHVDDVLCLAPLLFAQTYIKCGGDMEAVRKQLIEDAEKACVDAGMPDSLRGTLRELLG